MSYQHKITKNSASAVALAEGALDASRPNGTPHSNTGCTSRQAPAQGGGALCGAEAESRAGMANLVFDVATCCADVPQITPPLPSSGKRRRSRAKATSEATADWLLEWNFDYASLTMPNGKTGTGIKRGHDYRDITAAAGHINEDVRREAEWAVETERREGEREEIESRQTMCLFAISRGLVSTKIGIGGDGYKAGLWFSTAKDAENFMMVRGCHPSNMPGLVISGGEGKGDPAIRAALDAFPGALAARLDVKWDHSRSGYLDELLDYMRSESAARRVAPPEITDKGKGVTVKWGNKESGAIVTVYQKDLERLAKKRIEPADADPDLLRVEFRFSPPSSKKAAIADMAREHGPGALLGSIKWVRKMVEHIGKLTGAAKDATIAVQRVKPLKEPLTIMQRAAQSVNGSAKVLCLAVTEEIVRREFDGDWLAATIDEETILREVVAMYARMIEANGAVIREHIRNGLDAARTMHEEADRGVAAMSRIVQRNEESRAKARTEMLRSVDEARLQAGIQDESVSTV